MVSASNNDEIRILQTKDIMRFSIPFALFLFFTTSVTGLYAQESTQSITVSAEVVPSISGVELQSLKSLTLSRNDAVNGIITINPANSQSAGKMIAIGTSNSAITINYFQSRELSNSEGTGTMTFNYQLSGNEIDDQNSSELIFQDSRNLRLSADGEFFIWIGGSIDISNAPPGNYSGDFTLEIEYL